MFGQESRVSALESRKRLLVAESEVNRARLQQEWEVVAGGLANLAERARSFNTMASTTVPLVAGLAAIASANPARAAQASWLQKALNGARLVSTVWLVFRSLVPPPKK